MSLRLALLLVLVWILGICSAFFLPLSQFSPQKANPLASSANFWQQWQLDRRVNKMNACFEADDVLKIITCVNNQLKDISLQKGARFALDVVQAVSQNNSRIILYNHEFAHTIGGYAMKGGFDKKIAQKTEANDQFTASEMRLINHLGAALVECDGWGAFGCYHGVIEVGLGKLPPQKRTEVVKYACLKNPLIQSHQAFVNQCLHWFGHGMAIFTDQPLEETLAICDGLNTTWESDEVQLCISGVFHAGAQPGEVDKQYEHFLSRVYSSQDVYYPCRTVEKKFKGQCFSQVPGRFGPSVKGQFQSCSDIPESNQVLKTDYVKRCYDSAANNVIVEANYDPAVSVKKCREYSSKPDYVKFCYGGVVRYSILRNPLLNNRYPFEICKLAETENKSYCYRALGAANNENYFDKNILKEFCAGLEEQDYLNYCLLQANVE